MSGGPLPIGAGVGIGIGIETEMNPADLYIAPDGRHQHRL